MSNKFIYKKSLCCFYMLVSIHWMNSANAMEEDEKMYHSFIQNKQKNQSNKQQNNIHRKEEEKAVPPSQKNIQQGRDTMRKGAEGLAAGDEVMRKGFNLIDQRRKENLPVHPDSPGQKIADVCMVTGAATIVGSAAVITTGAVQYWIGKIQEVSEGYCSEPLKK